MRIALVSLNQAWEDKYLNLKQCEDYIEEAHNNGVDLVVFPEMTLTGYSMNIDLIAEKEKNSSSVKKFQILAKKYCTSIIFGVVFRDHEKATNNLIFIKNNGDIISKYKKIHPFSFSNEDKVYRAGNVLGFVNFMGLNIGLTICYDLRFPELYSAIGKSSDMVINIANWPKKRIDHWSSLLKARAIENQFFCIGVNRTGCDGNGVEYKDSSLIFNANGESLSPKSQYKLMKIFDIDCDWTKRFTQIFSTTQDRRVSLYKDIL